MKQSIKEGDVMEVLKKKKKMVQRCRAADWIEFLKAERWMNELRENPIICNRKLEQGAAKGGTIIRCDETDQLLEWSKRVVCKWLQM